MGASIFPPELEGAAFQAANGEFGWTRSQTAGVVAALRAHALAILGGELWWVPEGSTEWAGSIPQLRRPAGVYVWETKREPNESWASFIERSCLEAITAVERWPAPGELPPDIDGQILYNFTWCTETEFNAIGDWESLIGRDCNDANEII